MTATTLENQEENIQSFYEKEIKSLDKVLLIERIIRVEESTKSIQREMILSREEAEKRFQLQQKYMEKQFEAIDEKMVLLRKDTDKRFETMDEKLDLLRKDMDKRFEAVDKRFDGVDRRFDGVDKKFERADKRMDSLSSTIKWFAGLGLTYITILMTILKYFG